MSSKNILYFLSMGEADVKTLKALQRGSPVDWTFVPVGDTSGQDYMSLVIDDPEGYKNIQATIHEVFTKNKYDLVIVSLNYHPLVYQVVKEANKLNIPTMTIVPEMICKDLSYFFSPKKIFNEETLNLIYKFNLAASTPNSKYVICWSLLQKNLLVKRGVPDTSIFVCGHPTLDRYKKVPNTDPTLPALVAYSDTKEEVEAKLNCAGKKIISFYLESMEDSSDKVTRQERQKEILKYLIELVGSRQDLFLYIRNDPRIPLEESSSENYYIDGSNGDYLLDEFDSIYYSSLNICNISDRLLGSVLLKKPTVLVEEDLEGTFNFKESSGIPILDKEISRDVVVDFISSNIGSNKDLTEQQINYYLLNFLPCIYDGKNSLRVHKVMQFIMNLNEELLNVKQTSLQQFLNQNPNLQDPLYDYKIKAEAELNTK